jgi:pimeloyl-ACP methyl ester carboxylesterase
VLRLGEQRVGQRAERGVRVDDRAPGIGLGLGHDDGEIGHGGRETDGPVPGDGALWRQHHERGRHGDCVPHGVGRYPAGMSLTSSRDPGAIVAALSARAVLSRTTWPGGAMVWRAWGDGPPLVLLHGASGTWTHWIRNVPALADVVAAAIEQVVPPPSPLALAGFSFGSIVGGLVAARLRRRVHTLVLIGPGGTGLPLFRTPALLRLDAGPPPEAVHRENLARLMIGDAAAIDDLAVHLQMENIRRARFRSGAIPMSDALLKGLPGITARLCAIWGGRDAFMGPAYVEACTRLFRSFRPDVDVRVVPGAGHWVNYEAAETVNALLLEMLG